MTVLLDREKIRDCVVRLARGEDRRDADLVSASFWPEATIDHGVFAGSFDEYLAVIVPGSPAIPVTQHVLGQSVIEPNGGTAPVEPHVNSYHRLATDEAERDTMIGGRYLHLMQRRGSERRIEQRTMLYDWYQDFGRSVDWSQGVMDMPLRADHRTGRGFGDYSERFFGRWVP
ncbi:MAG TPA: nuclear transport factor 2 family protein [Mycobacterium sp.]|nr:nuclear transport factor 2 family protein [Mycobacterium sp.]